MPFSHTPTRTKGEEYIIRGKRAHRTVRDDKNVQRELSGGGSVDVHLIRSVSGGGFDSGVRRALRGVARVGG